MPADPEERRQISQLLQDVAGLRSDVSNLATAVHRVDGDCKSFREEVRKTWRESQGFNATKTAAWIGGAFIFLASLVQTFGGYLG